MLPSDSTPVLVDMVGLPMFIKCLTGSSLVERGTVGANVLQAGMSQLVDT